MSKYYFRLPNIFKKNVPEGLRFCFHLLGSPKIRELSHLFTKCSVRDRIFATEYRKGFQQMFLTAKKFGTALGYRKEVTKI